MTYTRDQLISALQNEYEFLIHDDFNPDTDMSADDHLEYLNQLSVSELVDMTEAGYGYTLEEYMLDHL